MDVTLRPRPVLRRRGRSGGAARTALTVLAVCAVLAAGGWAAWATTGSARGAAASPRASVAAVPSTRTAPVTVATSAPVSATVTATAPVAVKPVKPASKPATAKPSGFVVVIDAGHQGHADNRLEPIGPGSKTRKPAVASGTAGVVTRVDESVINLKVALRLRDVLTAAGVKVIMIRTTQNVDIPNSKRAQIANAAHAGLFIRLHCDGVNSRSTHGLLTLVPSRNAWTGPILSASARAGRDLHHAALAATGAFDRGITPRSDMSGFNWSKVPSVIVEMGVMSNPAEDRLLSTSAYEQKLASGIAKGVLAFEAGK